MATTSAPSAGRSRKPLSLWLKIFWGVLSTAAIVLFCVVFVWAFGSVYGTEICAETLERRSYFYLEIPLVGVQIRGVTRTDVSGELQKHLASSNLVTAPPANQKTWHAIHSGRGMFAMRTGDPILVVRYLDARNASHELAWLEWSKANPKVAAVAWKGVTDLAVAGKYTLIPDVLEIAEGSEDAVKAQTAVDQVLQKAKATAPVKTAPAKTPNKAADSK